VHAAAGLLSPQQNQHAAAADSIRVGRQGRADQPRRPRLGQKQNSRVARSQTAVADQGQ